MICFDVVSDATGRPRIEVRLYRFVDGVGAPRIVLGYISRLPDKRSFRFQAGEEHAHLPVLQDWDLVQLIAKVRRNVELAELGVDLATERRPVSAGPQSATPVEPARAEAHAASPGPR